MSDRDELARRVLKWHSSVLPHGLPTLADFGLDTESVAFMQDYLARDKVLDSLSHHPVGLIRGFANIVKHERQQSAADKAEIAALRKDAERYRFLRDAVEPPNGVSKADVIYLQHLHGEKLDAAIDATAEKPKT